MRVVRYPSDSQVGRWKPINCLKRVEWHETCSLFSQQAHHIVTSNSMSPDVIQLVSQSVLSIIVPTVALSVIGGILWACIRLINNGPKMTKYKQLPGPRGRSCL
jgi:hypothetical protein